MDLFLKLYFTAVPTFFLIDLIWLALIARKFYLNELGTLMKSNINWVAAIIFYLIFVGGLVFFSILPSVEKKIFNKCEFAWGTIWVFCLRDL